MSDYHLKNNERFNESVQYVKFLVDMVWGAPYLKGVSPLFKSGTLNNPTIEERLRTKETITLSPLFWIPLLSPPSCVFTLLSPRLLVFCLFFKFYLITGGNTL